VDFNLLQGATHDLAFRVAYRANADLWLDRIIVVSYPQAYATTAQWVLTPGDGTKIVQTKFIASAGNISDDVAAQIVLGAPPTATATPTRTPTRTVTPSATPALTPRSWLPLLYH
jgi:hypothetical protein